MLKKKSLGLVKNFLFPSVAFSWYPVLGRQLVFEVVSNSGLFFTGQHKPLGKVSGRERVLPSLLEALLTARRYPKRDSLFLTSWDGLFPKPLLRPKVFLYLGDGRDKELDA